MLLYLKGGWGGVEDRVRTTCHQKATHHRAAAFAKSHSEMFFLKKYIYTPVAVQLSVGDVSSAIHLDIRTRSTMKAGVLHTLGGAEPQRDSSFRVTETWGKRCKFKV